MDELIKSLSRTIDLLYSNALTRDDRIRYLNEIKGLISNYGIEIGHNHDIIIHSQPESNRDIMDTLNLKEIINELNKLSNQLESKNIIYVPVQDAVPQLYSLSPEPHENAYQLLVKENEQYKIDLETARAAEAKARAAEAVARAAAAAAVAAAAADSKVVTRLNEVIAANTGHPMENSLMNGIFSTMLADIKTESATNANGHTALYTKLKLLLDKYNKMQTVIFDIIKIMCDPGAAYTAYSASDVVTSYENHTKKPAPLALAGEVYASAIDDKETYDDMITVLDTKLVAEHATVVGGPKNIVFLPTKGYVEYPNIEYSFMHFLLNLSFDHLCNLNDMTGAKNAVYMTNDEIKDLYIKNVADITSTLISKQITVEKLKTEINTKPIDTNHTIINQLLKHLITTISDVKDCDYINRIYKTLCEEITLLATPYNDTINYITTLEAGQVASVNHISITDIINALKYIDANQLKKYIDENKDITVKDLATGHDTVLYNYIQSKDLNLYRFDLLKEAVKTKGISINTLEYIGKDSGDAKLQAFIDILVQILNFPFKDKTINTQQDDPNPFLNQLKTKDSVFFPPVILGGNNPLMDSKKANLSSRLNESHNYNIKKYGSSDIFFNHNSNISTIFTIIIMLLLCILIVIYIHNKKKYQHKMYNNCNLFMKDIYNNI